MTKKIILVAGLIVVILLARKIVSNRTSTTEVMGYQDYVESVENGNTLVLQTGLRVELLGVVPGYTTSEVWLKNNVVGNLVTLVSDSGCEQNFLRTDDVIKAYATMERDGILTCVNRLVVNDCPDSSTLAYMTDSLFVGKSNSAPSIIIHDPALYMKQRTMLVAIGDNSIGTGFFISKTGVAATNNHVLDGTKPACVYLYTQDAEDSKIYSSRRRNIKNVLFTNAELDITIFSVDLENGEEIQYFNLIKKHEPVGRNCHILGNPQGLFASYGKGVISAYREDSNASGKKLVQYDIATNGGNSGGPVINDKGEIIAVHAMGWKQQSNGAAAQGLNFGIDALYLREILDRPEYNVNYGGK